VTHVGQRRWLAAEGLGRPQEIATVVAFLAGERGYWVTAQNICSATSSMSFGSCSIRSSWSLNESVHAWLPSGRDLRGLGITLRVRA
jgi:hypothetical protein